MVGELEGGGPYLRLSSSGDADSSSTISPAKVIKYGLEILFCSEDLYLFVYFIFCYLFRKGFIFIIFTPSRHLSC